MCKEGWCVRLGQEGVAREGTVWNTLKRVKRWVKKGRLEPPYKLRQQTGQNMLKYGIHFPYNYLYINFAWMLYINCVCTFFWCYTFFISELMHTKCIPHFDKLFYTFCIQNLAAIVLLILYKKYKQKFVEMWDLFCIHQLYTSCTNLVHKMYTRFLCGYIKTSNVTSSP